MAHRLKALAGFVVVMAFLQVFIEDIMVFLGATSGGQPGFFGSQYVMMAIPMALMLTLFTVLMGAALLSTESLEWPPQ